MSRPRVARWGLVSSAAAPVLLIGGWTVAAARQPGRFDQMRETISALAGHGATDRWVMTSALAGLGVCHVVTALALRPASRTSRLVLGLGGVGTVLVAAFPLPADDSGSVPHAVAAGTAFVALAVWPAFGHLPSRRASLAAATALTGLVGWFFVELAADSGRVGLSERVAAGAQSVWPLVTVLAALVASRAKETR